MSVIKDELDHFTVEICKNYADFFVRGKDSVVEPEGFFRIRSDPDLDPQE
jgi:hypothetical protein